VVGEPGQPPEDAILGDLDADGTADLIVAVPTRRPRGPRGGVPSRGCRSRRRSRRSRSSRTRPLRC
jgi:hypothetical protein